MCFCKFASSMRGNELTPVSSRADSATYVEALHLLKADIGSQLDPNTLTSLRKFAHKIEEMIINTTSGLSPLVVNPKVELAARFSHILIRYIGLRQCEHLSSLPWFLY